MSASRILVLVPHPDDEIVGCCAAIARARDAGDALFALYLTTGVAPVEAQWRWSRAGYPARVRRRRREALSVAARLGLLPLGFGEWPSRTLKDHLPAARERIRRVLREQAIDVVWTPAYEGGHADHDATNIVASTLGGEARVVEFAEYNYRGGKVRCHEFATSSPEDVVLVLTEDERDLKAKLLAAYASERANLAHVRIGRERLRPLYPYDYALPPHAPPLFYQRFQWIPFQHPRVDFTSPAEISAAAAALRGLAGSAGAAPLRPSTARP